MTDAEKYYSGTSQEIWILSLYKQHFFDEYIPAMENQYSCWGYYDGLSLLPVSEDMIGQKENGDFGTSPCSYNMSSYNTSRLFEKKSVASISRIWCGSMYSSMSLNGRYSKQNIGIFRCNDTDDLYGTRQKKDELAKKSPFFGVVFVQLKEKEKYASFAEESENQTTLDAEGQNPYCILKCYYTFDNADLVVLLYSNSLGKLDYMLNWLKDQPDVNYAYSIEGVSEQYLKDCQKCVLPSWQGVKCFIDEQIAHMFLNVKTSGTKNVIPKLKKQFQELENDSRQGKEDCNNISFSFVQGRTDVIVDVKNILVKTMLRMYLRNGMLTHDNPLFGKEIYNIETSLAVMEMSLSDITEEAELPGPKKNTKDNLWFTEMAGKYEAMMKQVWEEMDEGTYADYCSLVQISNALAQYEGFTLSRDLFYLLYSPFKMFYERLSMALVAVDEEKKVGNSEKAQIRMQYIKESICEFTHGVNSVTSHTIHNNQFFLMIPGYTGTTFLIPVKLCMMYLWMAKKEIEILNDAEYKYSCLLTPGLESRPESTLINMGRKDDDRLIHFSSSQRSLYMPRHFMIILTHEMAHYVGKDIRNRRLRMNCIANTLTYYLAELVVPENIKKSNSWMSAELYDEIKDKIREKCAHKMVEKITPFKEERQIHATEIVPDFQQICFELVARNGAVDSEIKKLMRDLVIREAGKFPDASTKLRILESQLDKNRERLLTSQRTITEVIDELIQVYREVFSDMAAFCLLQCNRKEFSEAFNASEGKLLLRDSHTTDIQKRVRERIACKVFEPEAAALEEKEEESLSRQKNNSKNIFSFCWTGDLLYKYAQKSREAIDARAEEFEGKTRKLREQYQMFASEQYSCSEIYEKIMDSIMEYEKEINDEYKADRKQE